MKKNTFLILISFGVVLSGCEFTNSGENYPELVSVNYSPESLTQNAGVDDLEGLEGEPLNNWSQFPIASDALTVYVSSSSGSDSNSGLSPASPKRTIVNAYSLLREGFPDRLLLKRGDIFDETLNAHPPYYSGWGKNGRSTAQPMLVSSYGSGTQDPILNCPDAICLMLWQKHYVAIVGLHLRAARRVVGHPDFDLDAPSDYGISVFYDSSDIVLEGNTIEHFAYGFVIDAREGAWGPENITVRRNIIRNPYARTGHSQGMYIAGTKQLRVLENVFYHCGWSEQVSDAEPTIFNHSIYASKQHENLTIRRNIFAKSSSMAIKLRSAEVAMALRNVDVSENLFVENPIGISFGGEGAPSGGYRYSNILVDGNVITQGGRLLPNGTNWAIDLAGVSQGIVRNNYLIHNPFGPNQLTIRVANIPTVNLTITGNRIYDFGFLNISILPTTGVYSATNYVDSFTPNLIFQDVNRTLSTYSASIGLDGSSDDFIEAAISQQYATGWSEALSARAANAFLKQGFEPQ